MELEGVLQELEEGIHCCPFCGHPLIEITKEGVPLDNIYCHPLRFQSKGNVSRTLFRLLHGHCIDPEHFDEKEISCSKCGGQIFVEYWKKDPYSDDEKIGSNSARIHSIINTFSNHILPDFINSLLLTKKKIISQHPICKKAGEIRKYVTRNDTLLLEQIIRDSHANFISIITLFGLVTIIFGFANIIFEMLNLYVIIPNVHMEIANIWYGFLNIGYGYIIVKFGKHFQKSAKNSQSSVLKPYFGIDIPDASIIDTLIKNTSLVAFWWFIVFFYPSIITGSIKKFGTNPALFVAPIVFILVLTMFQMQTRNIPNFSISNKFPGYFLYEGYNESNKDFLLFLNSSIKRFFFGKKGKIFIPPLFFGLIADLLGLIYFINYIPYQTTFFEVITPDSNPIVYTSFLFNIGWLSFYLPFWFTIGTIVWLCLIIPNFMAKIAKYFPFRIITLQDIENLNDFGDILLHSNFHIVLLAIGFFIYYDLNSSIDIKLNLVFLGIFLIAIIFGFINPLYPIHKKMQNLKEQEINNLNRMIDYDKIKANKLTSEEISQNLLHLELIKIINAKPEWPFKLPTLIQIVIMVSIPLIEVLNSINSLLK
jgi:hypothetical protein